MSTRWIAATVIVFLGIVAVYPHSEGDPASPWLFAAAVLLVVWLCLRVVGSVLRRIREGRVRDLFIASATDDTQGLRSRLRRMRSPLIASIVLIVWVVAGTQPNQTVSAALVIATLPLVLWLIARALAALVRRLGRVGEDPPVARPSEFHLETSEPSLLDPQVPR